MKILPWEIIKVEIKKIGWLVLFLVAYIVQVNLIIFTYLGHLRGYTSKKNGLLSEAADTFWDMLENDG